MQNEPNLKIDPMTVTKVLTKNYETGEYPTKKRTQFVGQKA